jgi:hypothetical protein
MHRAAITKYNVRDRNNPKWCSAAAAAFLLAAASLPQAYAQSGSAVPIWGHDKLNAITTTAAVTRELQDMWDDGGRVVRIDVDQANNQVGLTNMLNIAKGIGFQKFVLVYYANITWTGSPPSLTTFTNGALALAQANPGPNYYIELSNEPNMHNISAANYATLAKAAYQAIKNAGLTNIVLLGSVGNSPSTVGGLSMHDWCAALVANGCTTGTGFDWANYHIYGNPAIDEVWWHIYTLATVTDPRTPAGQSCQSVFGNPPFAITEFGEACSWVGGDEAKQAAYISGWMQAFKAQSQCKLAIQFALGDEFVGNGSGFGLRRLDLSHRPSWDSYKAQATPAAPAPPTNLTILN